MLLIHTKTAQVRERRREARINVVPSLEHEIGPTLTQDVCQLILWDRIPPTVAEGHKAHRPGRSKSAKGGHWPPMGPLRLNCLPGMNRPGPGSS